MFAYRRKKRSNTFAIPVKACHWKIQVNWRAWLRGAIIILTLAGLLYLAIWSPIFKIKKLTIESTDFTATAQVQAIADQLLQKRIWEAIPGDSLITFSSQEASRQILASFPEVETVVIKRDIAMGVKIIVKGRQPAAIWCQSSASFIFADGQASSTEITTVLPQVERCFFIDSTGLIFHAAPAISGTALPTFFGQPGQSFNLRDQAIASSTIQFASQLKKQLREIEIDSPGFVVGAPGSQDLAAFTDGGWVAYFNASRSVQSQVKVLDALLKGDLKNKIMGLKYIDLRLAGKVYYK